MGVLALENKWQEELYTIIPKEEVYLNEPMKKHTSLKIGGPAEAFIKLNSIDNIKKIIQFTKKYAIPLYIIGNGSNLLVRDEGVKGIVAKIIMDDIKIEKEEDYIKVSIESGAPMGVISYRLLQNEITGFEELSGIPGTIGGAVRMNAGAHGKEMKDIVVSTTYMDIEGNIHTITNKEHEFEYRSSIFSKNKWIILETKLKLQHGRKEQIKEKMDKYANWRKEHQPLELPNAGSTFKRGKDFITASLIDECGLKGYTIGGAQISTKHAGFVVNTGNATAKDVLELVKHVKEQVYKKTGKKIELEIEVI